MVSGADESVERGADRGHEGRRAHAAQASELRDDAQDRRRLVSPIAVGSEVRRVGLDEERPVGQPRGRLPRPGGRPERDGQSEAHEKALGRQGLGHRAVPREGVQDAARAAAETSRPAEQGGRDVVVRLAVVDEDGQVALGGERQLTVERLALHIGRGQAPEVVEPDLADGADARVRDEALEPRPPDLVHAPRVMRVDADRGEHDARVAGRQLEGRLGRVEIPARDEDPLEAGGDCTLDDGRSIGVEARVLEMRVRVDEPGQPLRGAAMAQLAVSRSMRG